ncbi:NosD domain-containing protein [Eleftheria terrae]|uniref:NosD domain-containing protein n=1 Tax=Eleftheria terrae TaxID=1597781 RepID=UPI00263A6923|nr:NosD domain-containing protein [Eleftheria terrae]WKB55951.1 hypothetical protein N7L95_28165 [Eleftheria terrae]
MPITYIDSAAASSGDGSERSPKKYWDSSVDVSDGAVVLLKRGAVIELVNTVQPPGAITVRDYGDPAAAAPVLQWTPDRGIESKCTDSSKTVSFENVHFIGNGVGALFQAVHGARLRVVNCVGENAMTGVRYAASDSVVEGNILRKVTTGIYVGRNDLPKPSRGWISGNQVFATGDAVTLHDGVGLGVGNVIYGNTLIGGAPTNNENAVDVLRGWPQTVIAFNHLACNGRQAAIVTSAGSDGCLIYGNKIAGAGTGMALNIRSSNNSIYGNIVHERRSSNTATCLYIGPDSTGNGVATRNAILNNTFVASADTQCHAIKVAVGTSGHFYNNIVINRSSCASLEIPAGALAAWMVDHNAWWTPSGAMPFIAGGHPWSFAQWYESGRDRSGTASVDPLLDVLMRLPDRSPLAAAGFDWADKRQTDAWGQAFGRPPSIGAVQG